MVRALRIAVLTMLVAAGAAAAAGPARADTAEGCAYPRVCFYLTYVSFVNSFPTAAFQDKTSYFQQLGSRSYGSYAVYNTRNDDGARLRFDSGPNECLRPNSWLVIGSSGRKVNGIQIVESPNC